MTAKYQNATDVRRSLEARLKKISQEKHEDLQRLRRKVAFDRLLARLFCNTEGDFYLKGGYAMELRLAQARATKDIDLSWAADHRTASRPVADFLLDRLRSLANQEMGDHFLYTIGQAKMDLDNAPYGGARYPVSCFMDDRLFVRFHLDVGAEIPTSPVDTITSHDWFDFCGIAPPQLRMISREHQFAEKIHAYTLPRERPNTRVKDLIDLLLLIDTQLLDPPRLSSALQKTFRSRRTHSLPATLTPPPPTWEVPYHTLAIECDLPSSIAAAFARLSAYWMTLNLG